MWPPHKKTSIAWPSLHFPFEDVVTRTVQDKKWNCQVQFHVESTFTYHVKNLLKEICFMFGHQVQKILAAVLGRLCTCVGGTRRRWVSQCHNLFCLYLRPCIFYIFPLKCLIILAQVCWRRASRRKERVDPVELRHKAGNFVAKYDIIWG